MPEKLPLILPTLPGLVEGIVSRDPWTVQCQVCGVTATGKTPAAAITRGRQPIIFHRGREPRMCVACGRARGCTCPLCEGRI